MMYRLNSSNKCACFVEVKVMGWDVKKEIIFQSLKLAGKCTTLSPTSMRIKAFFPTIIKLELHGTMNGF